MCAESLQLCLTHCNPMDSSPPGSSVHGILLTRTLEWVAMSSSRGSSRSYDWTHVSCSSYIVGRFFTMMPPGSLYILLRYLFFYFTIYWKKGLRCTPMFTAALLIITKKWKRPNYPTTDEWQNAIHAKPWLGLKNVALSQRSRSQETTYCMISFQWHVQNRQIQTESRLAVA